MMNSVQPDIGNGHDSHRDQRTIHDPPPLATSTWRTSTATMRNLFVPYDRKKHLNLSYFKKPRGFVKILEIVIALIAMLAFSDSNGLFDVTITRTFCPVLITFAMLYCIANSGFPHLILSDESNRNGMLYAELVSSTFAAIVLLSLLACRFVMLLAHSSAVTDILLLLFVQLPLALIYIFEVSVLLRQWIDSSARPTIVLTPDVSYKPEAPPRTVFSSNNTYTSDSNIRLAAEMRPAELSVPAADIA